jgi:hypothetical protein
MFAGNSKPDAQCTTVARSAFVCQLGIGVGQVALIHVGGVYKRLEYLACGPPLMQAFHAEHACTSGDTIMSAEAYALVADSFGCRPIPGDDSIVLVTELKKRMADVPLNILRARAMFSAGPEIVDRMRRYIPNAVLPWMELDDALWASELRQVSVLFVSVGIKLGKMVEVSEAMLAKVQKVVAAIQGCVYGYEGALNKFLVDDKGSTMVGRRENDCVGCDAL